MTAGRTPLDQLRRQLAAERRRTDALLAATGSDASTNDPPAPKPAAAPKVTFDDPAEGSEPAPRKEAP